MNEAPIRIMQITPSSLVIYNEYQFRNSRSQKEIENEANLTRGIFNGRISVKAKRQITKKLNSWLQSIIQYNKVNRFKKRSKVRKPIFVTLTLPATQNHDDNTIKRKCLMPFLQQMKRNYDVKHYFWVAEAQKNGNIHFHIILDSYVPHLDIRALWISNLAKLGYIKQFFYKHGHKNPNCIDVHIVGGFDSAIKYVVKYVQKNGSNRAIQGRLHGLSDSVRDLQNFTTTLDNDSIDFIDDASSQKEARIFLGDHFTVIYCDVFKLESFKGSAIEAEFNNYLLDVYKTLYLDDDPINLKIQKDLKTMIKPLVLDESFEIETELNQLALF